VNDRCLYEPRIKSGHHGPASNSGGADGKASPKLQMIRWNAKTLTTEQFVALWKQAMEAK